MKEYGTQFIRNVGLVGHGGSGKTSLVEAFLFDTGAISRMGKVSEGTSVSDFDEEERRRQISVSTSVIPVETQEHKLNFLDIPGFTDFAGEVKAGLRVVEGALVTVDSVAGVEVGTELVWQTCDDYKLPRFVVVNKMDRENANFQKALASVKEAFPKAKFVPVQLPLGEQQGFKGVVDLLSMKARLGKGDQVADIPADLKAAADEARVQVIEAAAEGEDALLEKYLGGEELTDEEVVRGFRKVVVSGAFVPVFAAAGMSNIAVLPLLEGVVRFLPGPAEAQPVVAHGKAGDETLKASDAGPLCVSVWKTTADPFVGKVTYVRVISGVLAADGRVWNHTKGVEERIGAVFVPRGKEQMAGKLLHAGDIGTLSKLSATTTGDVLGDKTYPLALDPVKLPVALYAVAVMPKTQADSAKMGNALSRVCEEDPTLHWRHEAATQQTIFEGMGDQHIDVGVRRAETKFGVSLTVDVPKVPYRESITRKADAHHRHKKQTGGSGQFGEVMMRMEPLPEADFEFADELTGMNLSRNYLPPIEKGIRGVLEHGPLAGCPVVNVRCVVYDGKMHPVDSKPIAFETAGREAFKKGMQDAGPVLLEPVVHLRVVVPEANQGSVMGDLNTRRAKIQGMDQEGGKSVISADVPLAEVQRYVTDLRSITGGRGVFSMEFARYEVVPSHLAQTIIAAYQKEKKGGEEEAE